MVMFDGTSNGYRHSVLPLACSDPMVQRAVSVTSALHLAPQMPELRVPAEGGRASIIDRLRRDVLTGSQAVRQDLNYCPQTMSASTHEDFT